MSRREKPQGISTNEIKLKSDLDRLRREMTKLKLGSGDVPGVPLDAPAEDVPAAPDAELTALQQRVQELEETRERLSRLYFSQLEENRKRAQKLHQILQIISQINSDLDSETLLDRIAETIRQSLGFRIVLIRIREPGTDRLHARAFAGLGESAREKLAAEDVTLEDFLTWLKDEFKVSRSYFISHKDSFSKILPDGYVPDLGRREEWEWHEDDVLLVPLFSRTGELVAYFSVDDPVDRLVPSRETIELLESFGNHAVVAIENARLYHQVEAHARELEQAGQRMKEVNALKTNFVATVSHELRTPLTAIRAYVDTLLGAGQEEIPREQLNRFLTIINEESQRLARLIESVLDLSRFDSGHPRLQRRAVDLAEILAETVRLLEPVGQAGQVSLKVVNDLADTRVDADRDQMRQLVLHLGSNAVKFTPAGGTVTISLGGDEREVTLQVEDTGIGIPEAALERIFERFYQVDSSLVRRYGGTGLGLAICKSIVEWHGGRITVTSTPGAGSSFTVVLPRRTGPRVLVRSTPRLQAATQDVLKLAVEMVAEFMNARVVSLMACEPNGDLVVQAATGLDEKVVEEARIKPGSGVAGWVVEQRRPVCVARSEDHNEVPGSGRTEYRSATFLAVPIEGEQGLLGVLNVTDPVSQKAFDAEDCHLLLDLAERIGNAWQQAQSLEANQAGVEGATVALRHLLTHIERGRRSAPNRVKLARATARELGLGESDVAVIGFAATLHDVGMTLVGEDVVERGESLSGDQRREVQRHPELGAELLRPLETLGVVREIVLSHHEWWDGSGYPRRLRAEEIPLGARVLAAVDAFESMTVGRAHRPAMSRAAALEGLTSLKGRQFDPDVVEAFERALIRVEQQNAAATPDASEPAAFDRGR